jgi:uncharacterized repeat protein (TIGR01451 family)
LYCVDMLRRKFVHLNQRRAPVWAVLLCSLLLLGSFATGARATVSVTTTTNTATLATAIAAGNSGITLVGTPTLNTPAGATTATGTFTTSGSNLGISSGIVLSTGNASLIAGTTPGTLVDTAFSTTGVNNEFDVVSYTFSFTPNPNVFRLSIASVFMSEEYLDFVGQGYSDNFSMLVNGGAYTNFNVATIPGTTTGTDIDTVNNVQNAGQYRNNPPTGAAIPDINMDGATTVFINAFDVVPGTTYTVTIRVADVLDAQYDSAVFVSTSTVLNSPPALDLSVATAGTGFSQVYDPASVPVPIAAADDRITDDGATISSATITLTNRQTGDLLSVGTLPAGITASAYNPTTGIITLSGVSSRANYQAALRAILFSSAGPLTPTRTISVVVNDGTDNSNTAVTTITLASSGMTISKTASLPTVNFGASNAITDQNDRITFTYVITNTGAVTLTGVSPVDAGPLFNGIGGANTLSAFTPATATLAPGASQTFTATYTLFSADIANAAGITNGVTNTARATGTNPSGNPVTSPTSTARTSILTVASISLTKTAAAPSVAAGDNPAVTDAGDTIPFTYVIRNTGSVALTNAFPTDAGPRFNGVNGTNALSAMSPASGVALAAGASATFTATYTLSAFDVYRAAGILSGVTNIANASAVRAGPVTIIAPAALATTTIPGQPSLRVEKSFVLNDVSGGTAARADLNETITYTYVVTNIGNVALTNVSVNDIHEAVAVPLGAGGITGETLTPGPLGATASTPDATANNGIWSILAPGAVVTFTYTHTVTQSEIDSG